jgi:hypothetical protein
MDRMLKNGKNIRMARPKRKPNPFRDHQTNGWLQFHRIRVWFAQHLTKLHEQVKTVSRKWMDGIRRWGSHFLKKFPEVIKIKRATFVSLIVFAILLSSFLSIMLVSCIYDGDQPIETTVPPIHSNTATPTATLTPTVIDTKTPEPLPDHK